MNKSDLFCFYVYEHWRPDKDVCFYVGKGKGKRAWDMKNMRNRHHKAITSKLTSLGFAVDVRIVASCLSAEAAYAMEISRIAFYGQDNLANMTKGGEGLLNPSVEVRQKMAVAIKKAMSNPELRARLSAAAKNRKPASDETRKKISLKSTGRKHTPEVIEKLKVAAKLRGMSPATRQAQIAAVTGRKRAPFTEETIAKMRLAATAREAARRARKASVSS